MNRSIIIIIAVILIAVLAILVNTMLQEHSLCTKLDNAIEKLAENDPDVLTEAQMVLNEHHIRALPLLINATTDENEVRRANAVNVLGAFAPNLTEEERDDAVKAVNTRLDDVSPRVRTAAVTALTADFGYRQCSGLLQDISDGDPDIEVRMAALTGLGHIAGDEETRFLIKKLEHKNDHIVAAASRALGLTGRADALRALLGALRGRQGLAVHREQLIAVTELAGDLKGGVLDGKVISALDDLFRKTRPDSLLIQSQVDVSGGVRAPTPRAFLLELLNTYHKWDNGERIKLFFERISATTGEERDIYKKAVGDFIHDMVTIGFIYGKDILVEVEMSDADTKLMLFICGQLIDLIDSENKNFVLDNLRLITRLNFGDDNEHRPRALPLLINATTDENEVRRANAVNVLGTFAPNLTEEERDEAVEAVNTRLDDASPQVRTAAVTALTADFGYRRCSGLLQDISDSDPDIKVRMAAITGLGHIAGDEETRFLIKKLEHKNDRIAIAASYALGLTGRADALRALLSALRGRQGLAVHREQLIAVAELAGDLKGGVLDDKVISTLDNLFRETRPDSLLIQSQVDVSGGVRASTPRAFLLELLNTYYKWDNGERIKFFFERISTTTGEERDIYKKAVGDFIHNMVTIGFIYGKDVPVEVEMSGADTKLMLFICGQIIDLIDSENKNFVLDNLRLITRLNFGDDVVKWRSQYDKWVAGKEEFKVEPMQ